MVVHEHRLRVRYAETDQMGVVYHSNYLVYMEEGRTRLMASLGRAYSELERAGWGLAVRKVEFRCRASTFYDDELVVLTRVERVRGASVLFSYEIRREADDTLVTTGTTELACIRLGAERTVTSLPDDVREALERALEPSD